MLKIKIILKDKPIANEIYLDVESLVDKMRAHQISYNMAMNQLKQERESNSRISNSQ